MIQYDGLTVDRDYGVVSVFRALIKIEKFDPVRNSV